MLARYLPSSCARLSVRPSFCPSQAGIVSKRLDESSRVSTRRLPSTFPTLCYEEIWVSPKIRVLPSRTVSQTPDLENFAMSSRPRCQQDIARREDMPPPIGANLRQCALVARPRRCASSRPRWNRQTDRRTDGHGIA